MMEQQPKTSGDNNVLVYDKSHRRFVVYIGPPKTGSTSLQKFLTMYANRDSNSAAKAMEDWNYPIFFGQPDGIRNLFIHNKRKQWKEVKREFQRQQQQESYSSSDDARRRRRRNLLPVYMMDMEGINEVGMDISHAFACTILQVNCTSTEGDDDDDRKKWVEGIPRKIMMENVRTGEADITEEQIDRINNVFRQRDCAYGDDEVYKHPLFRLFYETSETWPHNCRNNDVQAMPAYRQKPILMLEEIRRIMQCPGYEDGDDGEQDHTTTASSATTTTRDIHLATTTTTTTSQDTTSNDSSLNIEFQFNNSIRATSTSTTSTSFDNHDNGPLSTTSVARTKKKKDALQVEVQVPPNNIAFCVLASATIVLGTLVLGRRKTATTSTTSSSRWARCSSKHKRKGAYSW
eukprot:scaffold7514_cov67-Cylindrotheca_fusiformis.AAC.4